MERAYRWRHRLLVTGAWLVLAFLLLPVFVSFPFSLSERRYLSWPSGGLSLNPYVDLLESEKWLGSFWQSLVIATLSSLLATVLGTLCAVGLWRIASRYSEMLRGLLLAPVIVPPIVSALGFYQLFVDLGLLDSYAGIVLAHAILASPFVVITVAASLAGFNLKLEQAARSLGASMLQTLRLVILPAIRPGVLSGAVFAFILSWDEIVVTLFITRFDIFTLPRRMWDGIREHTDPKIAAAAAVLILLTVIGTLISLAVRRRSGDD